MKTNKLVQGAMIAALFGVMSLLNTLTGTFFDVLIGYFMVIPLVWYGYHNTVRDNLIVSLVCVIIVLMQGQLMFTLITIETCGFGVTIGECLKRGKQDGILLSSFIISFIANILIYQVFAGVLGIDMNADVKETYDIMIKAVPAFKQVMSLSRVMRLIPLVILMTSVMESYVVVLIVQVIATRIFKDIPFPGDFHIANFHIKKPVGYVIMALGALSYLLSLYTEQIVITYICMICLFILMINGISVIALYCVMRNREKLSGIGFLLLLIPFINIMIALLGAVDIIGDLKSKIMYNDKVSEGRDNDD